MINMKRINPKLSKKFPFLISQYLRFISNFGFKTADFSQSGQIFVLSTIVLVLIMVSTVAIIGGSLTLFQNTKHNTQSVQAINLAEAGLDKAAASLNTSGSSYNGETQTSLGVGEFDVSITSINSGTKLIKSTGYIPNKANFKSKKTIQVEISKGDGVSFNYGVQVGEGGLNMQNNAIINGSVYSNGNISMNNGSKIAGDSYVAGGVQPTADQQSDCLSPSCNDFTFGKSVSGNNQLDIAQSFKPQSTQVMNKVSLKLKKIGSPSNLTIRLLPDNSGKPAKTPILATGTLGANLVSTQYGYVEVALTPTPTLTANTTYWIMIDTSANNTNYWQWSIDTTPQNYSRGQAMWSADWTIGAPIWNSISGDLGFKTFMGGVPTSITGANNAQITGSAYANTLSNLSIAGDAYYQLQNNIVVRGSACTNNTHCFPNSVDPASKVFPISDSNIQEWETEATTPPAIQFTGNINGCQSVLQSGKYNGNVTLSNGCNAVMFSPIWITGNLVLDNGSTLKLDSSYGTSSGVIIVEGTIRLQNNGKLNGTGVTGSSTSYLTGISNYNSKTNGLTAIDADNGSNTSILYAPNGIIYLHNNASLTEVNAWKLTLDNGASVNYNTGLSDAFFSSGPSGSYSVVKGTYQSK